MVYSTFFYFQKRKYGKVLAPNRYWGRIPRLLLAMGQFYSAITSKKSKVSADLKSLIMVRVSQINDCSFCVDLNSSIYLRVNTKMEKLQALEAWSESSLFSSQERISLEYAEAMTDPYIGVTDHLRDRLKEYYSEDALIELTATIAFQNLSSKFNHALGIESQEFCTKPYKCN